jgi:hypothetical protein
LALRRRARSDAAYLPTWDEFLAEPRAEFLGEHFSLDEVEENAGWLYRNGFIDGPTVAEVDGPVRAHLTDRGVACVERPDGDPTRYIDGTLSRSDTHINVHGGNVQIATGDGSQQSMEIHAALERFELQLDGIVDLLASLGVGELPDLRQLKAEAIADLRGDPHSDARVRTFAERAKALASKTGNVAMTAAMTTLTDGVVNDAVHLVSRIVH